MRNKCAAPEPMRTTHFWLLQAPIAETRRFDAATDGRKTGKKRTITNESATSSSTRDTLVLLGSSKIVETVHVFESGTGKRRYRTECCVTTSSLSSKTFLLHIPYALIGTLYCCILSGSPRSWAMVGHWDIYSAEQIETLLSKGRPKGTQTHQNKLLEFI